MLARLLGYNKIPTKNNSAIVKVSYIDTFKNAILDDNLEVAYDVLHNHLNKLKLSAEENKQSFKKVLDNALYFASGTTHRMGPTIVTELLLPGRADPNVRRVRDGDTPLSLASYVGNLDIVRQLLGSKANPDIGRNDGATPLMMASEQGHVEVVKLLLTHGADMNLKDTRGYTALDYANAEIKAILKRKISAAAQWALKQNTEHEALLGDIPRLRKGGRRTRRKTRKSHGTRRKARRY